MGELAALALADSVLRFVPGSMGDARSCEDESFSDAFGGKLEHPLYTRPPTYEGLTVPADLLSGDHARISKWKHSMSHEITKLNRPDLIQEGDIHERK
jgi:tRNA (guanine37-N1)-methyltransferase